MPARQHTQLSSRRALRTTKMDRASVVRRKYRKVTEREPESSALATGATGDEAAHSVNSDLCLRRVSGKPSPHVPWMFLSALFVSSLREV